MDDTDPSGDVLAALADPRRRRTLAALEDLEPPASLETLAAAVDDAESTHALPGEPTPDGGTRLDVDDRTAAVAASLYHVHLPTLDETGLVSFDPDSMEVSDWRLDGPAAELL